MFKTEIDSRDAAVVCVARCVVLAIEDDEMLSRVSSTLSREHHQVVELEDGAELVDYFELRARLPRRISRPDAVVAQLELPGVSGLSVLLGRRSVGDGIPFAFFVDGTEGSAELHAAHQASASLLAFPRDLPRLSQLLFPPPVAPRRRS